MKASVKIVVKSDSDLHKALDRMVQILEPGGVTVGKTLLKLHTERPYDSLLLDASLAKKALRTTTTRKIRLMHCCSYLGSVFSEQFLSSSWTPELAAISNLRRKWNIIAKMAWTRFCLLGPPFSKQSVSQSVFRWSFSSVPTGLTGRV